MSSRQIRLFLKPETKNNAICAIRVTQELTGHGFEPEAPFAEMKKMYEGCLSAYYNAEDITAADDLGPLGIIAAERNDKKVYAFHRKTSEKITLQYLAPVCQPFAWPNPALSLHNRNTGATGFACTFLLIPYHEWDYRIDYDDTEIQNTYCACNYGIGSVAIEPLEYEQAQYLCFAFGAPYRFHNGGNLNILYFEHDLKFMSEITACTSAYYDYMEEMFGGMGKPYFIFLYRKDKKFEIDLTGTAIYQGCLMGYGDELVTEYREIDGTICHELVHNFLLIDDENEAYSSIFAEGAAEYFSLMIPYILGIHDTQSTVDRLNQLLKFYYSNPWKEKSLEESVEKAWTHSYACRIAYGKGLIMMISLEALLKKHHSPKRLIDYMADLSLLGQDRTVAMRDFLDLIDQAANGDASAYFRILASEGAVKPIDGFLDGYRLTLGSVKKEENGFDDTVAFAEPKVVTGLREGSNAYKAGLRNGDVILGKIDEWGLGHDENKLSVLHIMRGNQTFPIRYSPRTEDTYCYFFANAE